MKLVNSLAVAFLGALMVTGCTVTDDTGTDGGTDGGTDTLTSGDTAKTDTLTTDTATGETASETGTDCPTCVTSKCNSEITACTAEASCKSGLDCFNACADKDCKNACLSNSKNPDGTAGNNKLADIVTCAATNCKTPCGL
jgi:hypothetical protein